MQVVDRHRSVRPLIDGVFAGSRLVGIGVFPPDLSCVGLIDEHDISRAGPAPGITCHARMSILLLPALLPSPIAVAMSPAKLLEGTCIGGVPHMHTDVSVTISRIGAAGVFIGQWSMLVVHIAIVIAVPTGLHAGLVSIEYCMILTTQWSLLPNVSGITIDFLSKYVVLVDVEEMPLVTSKCLLPCVV